MSHADEIAVTLCLLMPVGVLHESIVTAEIHADGLAVGGMGNQFCGNAAVFDGWQSPFHPLLIMIQFLGRTRCWLEIAIVALRSKNAMRIKSSHFELTVNIGGDNEIIFTVHHLQ